MSLLVLLVLGGLYGFDRFRDQAIADFFAKNQPPPTPVAVAVAKLEDVPRYLPAIGTLAAVRQVTVAPEVAGRVTTISFEAGATVSAGAPLVQLNDKTERADLLALKAQARLAELNLARSRELLERQATAKATVDQQQAQLDEINANIQKTEAQIAYKLIRAPFDGVLGIRQVDIGQFLNAGTPIVTLTDLSRLYVNFTLPEQARPQLAVGQAVEITNDAFPGKVFAAQVTAIEPQVSVETRSIKVQATMENPEHLLLPGMFANVRVVLPPQKDVVTIPETAVDYTLYGNSVFVVREEKSEDGTPALKVVRTPVETGDRFMERVVVLKGVAPGDRVAASGQLKLSNGAPVTIKESSALTVPEELPLH
ncbi:MAG: efflux RND transporter periplasmic adaptor subunit [Rhodospirillales bacterium]|nr:efflux RND transporter periplasmic adaptor subunit [Rhodospirillales bacterium]